MKFGLNLVEILFFYAVVCYKFDSGALSPHGRLLKAGLRSLRRLNKYERKKTRKWMTRQTEPVVKTASHTAGQLS